MKRAMLIFMTFCTLVLSAQEMNTEKRKSKTDFNPEQRAELRSKQMTLELDLSESQQAQVKQLFLKSKKNRTSADKKNSPKTSSEKFQAKSERLDNRIAFKKELKNILNDEQFEKWENSRKSDKRHNKRKKFKNRRNRN